MSKTLVGLVTFGNVEFTKLAIQSVRDTSTLPVDFFVIVGKPGDTETIDWLGDEGIPHMIHEENYGFPLSLNDIADYAWKYNDYDNLIVMGNDVIVYPNAIDSLINVADTTDYEVVSALQYDVKSLLYEHPETIEYFKGASLIFSDWTAKPWETFTNYNEELNIADMQLYDIQNLCLYTRKSFEELGYVDVNFYPAYYVDNDYARRIVESKMKCCSLTNARFFHFWSRTIHQGEGGSNSGYFINNRKYYVEKWGGDFSKETKTPDLAIHDRTNELEDIAKWKQA